MSTLTPTWTVNMIREIYQELDKKTGLKGAALPIKLQNTRHRLGGFSPCPGKELFLFSIHYLNDPLFPESEAIQLLRHEYAHYYVYATRLWKWLPPGRTRHHGKDWKFACYMLSAYPRRCYSKNKPLPELTPQSLLIKKKADDVRACDIICYLKRWDALPIPEREEEYRNLYLEKQHGRSGYFRQGDRFVHVSKGYGTILDSRPGIEYQLLYVRYENGDVCLERSTDVYKISDAIIMAPKTELDSIHI